MVSLTRVSVLTLKELADLAATPAVMVGPVLLLLASVAVPFLVTIGVPWWTGDTLANVDDLVAAAYEWLGPSSALAPEAAAQVLLLARFLPLLVLVPIVGGMALVTTSIVDELRSRSLEPLLATPITTFELLVAKAGSAFLVAIALLAAGAALFAAAVALLAGPGVLAALTTPATAALLVGLAPAATAAALTLGVVVSSRAKDARAAQQFSVLIVLPLVTLFVGRLDRGVPTATILATGAAAWLLAIALAVAGVWIFDRERILTRWTQ